MSRQLTCSSLPYLFSLFSQLDGALMLKFDSLVNLDLRRNSISEIDISIGKLYFHIGQSVTCVRQFLLTVTFVAFMLLKPK